MANSIQHVLLTGNIGKIHEFQQQDPNATKAIYFSLAVKNSVRQQDGSYSDNTTWVDCKTYGRTAEYVVEKGVGAYVAVTGDNLSLRTYQTQNGQGSTITLAVQKVHIQPSYFNGGDNSQQQPQAKKQAQAAPQQEPDFDDVDGDSFPF